MSNKISVITVVFNDKAHIRQTMESYFSQTYATTVRLTWRRPSKVSLHRPTTTGSSSLSTVAAPTAQLILSTNIATGWPFGAQNLMVAFMMP